MKNDFTKKSCLKLAPLILLPLLLLAAGCHQDKVRVYQVTDNQEQSAQPAAPAPATNSSDNTAALLTGHPEVSSMGNSQMPGGVVASDVQNAEPLTWTTPPGWTSVPPSEMRVASFKVAGDNGAQADVSVVPLSGTGGGDFANVNRWRGQVGLQDASDDVLQNSAENIEAGGQPAQLFDIAGQSPDNGKPAGILGVIQHRDDTTWFFKMTGDANLIEQQKPEFIAFLKSLSFAPAQTTTELPPGHPAIDDTAPAAAGPVSTEGQPSWQVPADWQQADGGQFLVAKFMITGGDGATATVNVSSSAGDGGGFTANVNRWRGQLGLPPANEFLTITFPVNGGQGQLVNLSGTNVQTGHAADLQGIMITLPDRTWFYKLMGDPHVVESQKAVFTTFVKGVKY